MRPAYDTVIYAVLQCIGCQINCAVKLVGLHTNERDQ